MPDWKGIVASRLDLLSLEPAEMAEVIAEVATHLEETFLEKRRRGLKEEDAVRRTLAEAGDWQELRRKILIAKRGGTFMQKRVRQLWIPGFLALILSMLFLMVLQKFGLRPRILGSGPSTILFYVPWLLSLPFFGALGAYVSSRAGGSARIMLLASVFPVLALTTAFLLMFPIAMTIETMTGNHVDFGIVATALLKDGIGWILVPGAALLIGGLPAQLYFSRRLTSRGTAGN